MKKLILYGLLLIGLFALVGFYYSKAKINTINRPSSEQAGGRRSETEVSKKSKTNTVSIQEEGSQNSKTKLETKLEELDTSSLSLEDVYFKDKDDQIIQLSHQLGKPIIINIWATWCPPCREEMPYFQEVWNKYKEQVDIYMVNGTFSQPNETKDTVDDFVLDMNLTLPIYYDSNFSTMLGLQANFLPTTVFIDSQGNVSTHHIGEISEQELENEIQKILYTKKKDV